MVDSLVVLFFFFPFLFPRNSPESRKLGGKYSYISLTKIFVIGIHIHFFTELSVGQVSLMAYLPGYNLGCQYKRAA